MGHTSDDTKLVRRSRNPFLSCFGFSVQLVEKNEVKLNSDVGKKSSWKFRWSSLKIKMCKQVHVDDKITRNTLSVMKREMPAEVHKPLQRKHKPAHDEIHKHSKTSDDGNSTKTGIFRLSPRERIEAKQDIVNLKQSMILGHKSSKTSDLLSNVPSFALHTRKKRVSIGEVPVRAHGRKIGIQSESINGLSIVMVTLLIMLIWGKVCAVLCTCVWLCIIPRLQRAGGSDIGDCFVEDGSPYVSPNMDYEKVKKKVILEGFLERKPRSTSRMLPSTNKDIGES